MIIPWKLLMKAIFKIELIRRIELITYLLSVLFLMKPIQESLQKQDRFLFYMKLI